MLWRAKGRVGFWATRLVGVMFCSVRPRLAAPLCTAPTRTARGMVGFWIRQVFVDKLNQCANDAPHESTSLQFMLSDIRGNNECFGITFVA